MFISLRSCLRSCHTQRVLIRGRREWLSSSKSSLDPYHYYRHPSEGLWHELQEENERSLKRINSSLRHEFQKKIESLSLSSAAASNEVPETGPTGKYHYSMNHDHMGNLLYSRQTPGCSRQEHVLELKVQENHLHAMTLSPDEAFISYSTSPLDNPLQTEVWVRHIRTGTQVRLQIDATVATIEFGSILLHSGEQTLFYTTTQDGVRPDSVFAFVIYFTDSHHHHHHHGFQISSPQKIYSNHDTSVMVDVQRTKGCRYVAISAPNKTTNEIYLVSDPRIPPLLVRARRSGVRYHVDVGTDNDVIIAAADTNDETQISSSSSSPVETKPDGLDPELSIFEAHISQLPLKEFDRPVAIDGSSQFNITDIELFASHLVLTERSRVDGVYRFHVVDRSNGTTSAIITPEDVCDTLTPAGNMTYDAESFYFSAESPAKQLTSYVFNLKASKKERIGEQNQSKTLLKDNLTVQRRILVSSSDGIGVPMSILHNATVDPSSKDTKVILVGYGAYGTPVMSGYDPSIASLVRSGFIVAYAHTRGGGELGNSWYEQGRMNNKWNAVEDYLACARYLVDNNFTADHPPNLTARAFSAGGIVVGAAINENPGLFGKAVFVNAFLDLSTTNTSAVSSSVAVVDPLRDHEIMEWGDPSNGIIKKVCPSRNIISDVPYPKSLIIGTLDDLNVPYWHSVTYWKRLKELSSSNTVNPLLYVVGQGGHHMHSSRIEVESLINAFIADG